MKRLILAVATLGLAACGGSRLSLDITDAPDTENLASVTVTLSKVEAHVVDKDKKGEFDPNDKSIDADDKWQSVPLEAKEFDLLKLQNDVTASLGELDLPEGKLTQIRLFIDEAGKNEVALKTGQICKLDLTNVEKGGIKINHPFKALDLNDGKELKVVVDFDLNESVSKVGECQYKLVPVIKIKKSSEKDL